MADAIAAYKEAFACYRKSPSEFAKYSLLQGILLSFLTLALSVGLVIIALLVSGSLGSFSFSREGLTLGLVGVSAIFLLLAIGALAFLWMEMGLTGAYLETMNMLLLGKKQTLNGFLSAMPRRATPLTSIAIFIFLLVFLPLAAFLFVAVMVASGNFFSPAAIAIILLGALFSFFLFLLASFAIPCSIVDNKGALESVKRSFFLGPRNLAALAIYYIITAILLAPILIPGVGLLYTVLFASPLLHGALLAMYRKLK